MELYRRSLGKKRRVSAVWNNLGNLLWLHLHDTHHAEARLQRVVAKLDANMDKIAAYLGAKTKGKEAEQELRALRQMS